MKKIVFLSFYLILILCSSCETSNQNSQSVKEIQETIEKANSTCPLTITKGITLLSIEYHDNTVFYDYELDCSPSEKELEKYLSEINSNMKNIKSGLIDMLKGEIKIDPNSKKLVTVQRKEKQ
jgi:hypothetical protein